MLFLSVLSISACFRSKEDAEVLSGDFEVNQELYLACGSKIYIGIESDGLDYKKINAEICAGNAGKVKEEYENKTGNQKNSEIYVVTQNLLGIAEAYLGDYQSSYERFINLIDLTEKSNWSKKEEILMVKDEEVKIQLCCDENQEGTGARWFSFSSIYSSGDGSGWYCMPEPGDLVRLYFPTAKEEEAYVISSFHEDGAALRTKPAHKFWRNKEGKEIRLSPERILITNNDGTSIELSDEEGIEIISENSVTIRAGNSLSISSSDSSIELDASRRIRMKQGDTEMTLGGDIFMQGGRIRL